MIDFNKVNNLKEYFTNIKIPLRDIDSRNAADDLVTATILLIERDVSEEEFYTRIINIDCPPKKLCKTDDLCIVEKHDRSYDPDQCVRCWKQVLEVT